MLKVTKASLYKMFHDRALWLCLVGTVAWAMIVITAQVMTASARGISDVSQLANRWYGFIGLHSIEVPLILCAVLLFSSEYRDKSWRLLIARGISTTNFYVSKLICMLLLTVIISFTSIMTTAIANVVILHAPFSMAYVGEVLRFFVAECLAHLTIAVFVLTVIFLVRRGEIAVMISLFFMMYGYVILFGLEEAFGIDAILTDAWVYSQTAYVEFGGYVDWLRLCVTFVCYLVVCSLLVTCFLKCRDIE